MIKTTLASVSSLLLLVACGQEQYVLQKPGASSADMQRDDYECERDTRAAAASFSGGLQGAGEAQAFYGRCMATRGYAAVPASNGHPPTPQTDATGRPYGDNDRVMCSFPSTGPVNLQAKACAQGGGTINGPA